MSNFLFPIETTARELDHKILMAILAAKEGRKIFVGDQQIIRTLSFILKGGVFYGKHLFGKPSFSDKSYYNRLKASGVKLVHLNEEGAVWPGSEFEWQNILKQCERPSQLDADDFLATWGQWQKEYNESYEATLAQIRVTGHPRFDLYSKRFSRYFKAETEKLLKAHGDFILVNTAFSYSNNGEGGVEFIFKPNIAYETANKHHREYRFKRWRRQMYSIADIVDVVNQISLANPNKKIIIRPHPSEDTKYYKDIFQNIKNVEVIYEGAVTPWILACKLMIHNGCTTAIEATLAGKPVVNYSSSFDPTFDVYLANICGVTFDNVDAVLKYVDDVYNEDFRLDMPKEDLANKLFHNFENDRTSEKVLSLLDEADGIGGVVKPNSISGFSLKMIGLAHYLYICIKYSFLAIKGRGKDFIDYKKRFEFFQESDIASRVSNMSSVVGRNVKLRFISSHLFCIEVDKNDTKDF